MRVFIARALVRVDGFGIREILHHPVVHDDAGATEQLAATATVSRRRLVVNSLAREESSSRCVPSSGMSETRVTIPIEEVTLA